ncbi:LysR family transcriptional regulator [Pseudooceanicola nanhaiensis]|uniref:LysR family transcriptional regulator n=1 Tax=Pseudooceanicola nanhaiensis TaxID=375761 RepID=UPI001CD679AD|nr:LysR family transcriptional regulator [Pseudooceanicola nanhaiensis]MCA0922514.1 LysR family transcriptional regulator [Pseudooceanicola nanhaiensis]
MRIGFDFADLEAFLVLYETGSFVAAARHLGQSQSSITRRVRKLEEELGTRLFERTTRSVRPTQAARQLRGRAQAMMDEARGTLRALRDVGPGTGARAMVTLAHLPGTGPGVVDPVLGLYGAAQDAARVRLLELPAEAVAEAVREGTAEIGITGMGADLSGLTGETLGEDRIGLVMLADHPMAGEGPLSWEALEGQRLILTAPGGADGTGTGREGTGSTGIDRPGTDSSGIDRAGIDAVVAERVPGLLWRHEVPGASRALELVRAGLGVALLPRAAVPLRDGSGLAWRALEAPVVARRLALVTRPGGALSEAAQALCAMIREGATGRGGL